MLFFEHALRDLSITALGVVFVGNVTARSLRSRHLRWTWALAGLPIGFLFILAVSAFASSLSVIAFPVWAASLYACALGRRWHRQDLENGADHAELARGRLGIVGMLRRRQAEVAIKDHGWIRPDGLIVGRDGQGMPVPIPIGFTSGSHTLVVGATGSGKTVSETWIACRLIDRFHGAVVIDPKGDDLLRRELKASAEYRGVRFREWTPEGPLAYNPYAHGTDTEIADKALSGEEFTEPHYLREAQRYVGHAVRVMHAAGVKVTPVSLMANMDPRELEVRARNLPEAEGADALAYLDSLGDRQRRDLSGVRDRLSVLAESDLRQWLDPNGYETTLNLQLAVRKREVVYFRLDADRRPLVAGMLAASIVSDLITLVAEMQKKPVATVVMIDEFSAIAAEQAARLFSRARTAGVSLILGTQELADLKSVGDGALREQTLGNVEAVIAHRQNVPESAELLSAMAGTKPAWVTTQQTEQGFFAAGPSGRGTRRRGYEFEVHPSRIKQLRTGEALVITPGSGPPAIAQMCHPNEAHR